MKDSRRLGANVGPEGGEVTRTYRAPTLPEAFLKAKLDLGDRAVILSSTVVKKKRWFRPATTEGVVVAAPAGTMIAADFKDEDPEDALPEPVGVRTTPAAASEASDRRRTGDRRRTDPKDNPQMSFSFTEATPPPVPAAAQNAAPIPPSISALGDTVHSHHIEAFLKAVAVFTRDSRRESLAGPGGEPRDAAGGGAVFSERPTENGVTPDTLAGWLRAGDVSEPVIARVRAFAETIPTEARASLQAIRPRLHDFLVTLFPEVRPFEVVCPIGPRRPRVVMFVGPTGVGKTTTLAKFAANFALRENLQVGTITFDTYRVAAIDQLRMYTEIIGVPMEIVWGPADYRKTVGDRFASKDLVLVDTAGRNHRVETELEDLRHLIAEERPDEIVLVVCATTSRRDLVEIVRRYRPLGFSKIVLTKVDESVSRAATLDLVLESGCPIVNITDGQMVPDDLKAASPEDFVRAILDLCEGQG